MKLQQYLIYLFPLLFVFSAAGAATLYFIVGDWKRGCYWAGVAFINVMVTML